MSNVSNLVWPEGGNTRIPYQIYSDPAIFRLEMDRIFGGAGWSYVGLEIEIPNPGDFKVTRVGDRSVVITRDEHGEIRGFVNRCAHRGVKLCRHEFGNTRFFVCPYHQWSYDATGALRGVPFIKGVNQLGGMPEDFERTDYALPRLITCTRNGVIFGSFSESMPALEDVSRRGEHALLRSGIRRARVEAARLLASADPRQLEADVREHQGSVSRVAAARFPGHVRIVPRRPEVAGADGSDRAARVVDLAARRCESDCRTRATSRICARISCCRTNGCSIRSRNFPTTQPW